MSLPSTSSSIHTYSSTSAPKKQEDVKPTAKTPTLTRLERANRAIAVLEKRLTENKRALDRCKDLESKLQRIDKDMDTAYIKIKGELMHAELGRHYSDKSSGTVSHATSLYDTDYLERSLLSPKSSFPMPRYVDASLEKRLISIERSLRRLDGIESVLKKLSTQVGVTNEKIPKTVIPLKGNLYGCHEISEVFKQTQEELQKARAAISKMLTMPAIYSRAQTISECIRDRSELEVLGKMIDRFLTKIGNSKRAYENACGDASRCIVCSMRTTSSAFSKASLY
ncbi:unnamed protein product [Cylicocyclus nassatus]|uniref:Uncharacterized protein n=1 Tax=Cylicocyclus nassatus TaxID=53992 RepID=A0AA36DRF2_CYLNA|nr:unnamed protein product [Cylicocyclus nassatus]